MQKYLDENPEFEDIINEATKEVETMELSNLLGSKLLELFHLLGNYRVGFNILMDYWDYFPDDEKVGINDKLKKLGL